MRFLRLRLHRGPAALLVLLLLPAPGCSGGDGGAAADGLRPAPLAVTPARLELPRIPFGATGRGSFELRNTGDAPLRITRIGPTNCDCALAQLELPDRPEDRRRMRVDLDGLLLTLAPGERAVLHFELITSRWREPVTWKSGSIPILFEDYDYQVLEWTADIWNPYWLEPWAVELGRVGTHDRPTGVVMVRANDEPHFRLRVPAVIDGWELRVSEAPEDGNDRYRIDVRAPAELPLGPFQKEFTISSDLEGAPPVRFTVQGYVEPNVGYSPTRLVLRPAAGRPSDELMIRYRRPDRLLPLPTVELPDGAEEELDDHPRGAGAGTAVPPAGDCDVSTDRTEGRAQPPGAPGR